MTEQLDIPGFMQAAQFELEMAAKNGAKVGVRDALELSDRQKNAGFKMIFPKGWVRLQELAKKKSPIALRVWLLLAEYAGPEMCVCVRQEDLALELNVSTKSIQRAIKVLEDDGALILLKEFGMPVYCLDPSEMWASWQNAKNWAPFRTKTLVAKNTPEGQAFAKRLAHMVTTKVKPGSGPVPLPGRYKTAEDVPQFED